MIGVVLYATAAFGYFRLYRRRRAPFLLGVALSFALLAEAMLVIAWARNWHASWWEWHLLMLTAFVTIAVSARGEWHEERFSPLYLDETLADTREATIMFADLQGFTSFSERTTPARVATMLNGYFGKLVPLLEQDGGVVHQIVGDAVMVIFNQHGDEPDHAVRAVRTALAFQSAATEIASDHPDWPRFRAGVNSGEVLAGLVGGPSGHRKHGVVGSSAARAQVRPIAAASPSADSKPRRATPEYSPHVARMKILVVGTGGVGAAVAAVAQRRDFFERITFADLDPARPQALVDRLDDDRFAAAQVDASDQASVAALAREADAVLNATDPRFNLPIFEAAFESRCTYLDMAMSLSSPETLLGQEQLDQHERWADAGLLALVGIGVEPGLSDVFARYAADHLFAEIDEVAVRDGANLAVEGYEFAPTFSIWTTIEECLNPPLVWERERGWYTTEPFSEPEVFDFPEGIGPLECVNVEHEEVVLVPRWVECNRVTFKYGLGEEFIDVLKTLHKLGLDSKEPISVRGVEVAPRDVLAAALPDPATLGDRMHGKTCAGTFVTGTGKDGEPRSTYLYHVADNEQTMREYGSQAVVLQTALNPVVALELLAAGTWKGAGVLGPEAFDAVPFLELLAAYGEPHGQDDR